MKQIVAAVKILGIVSRGLNGPARPESLRQYAQALIDGLRL